MSGFLVVFPDRQGRLPSATALRSAGFQVSSAVAPQDPLAAEVAGGSTAAGLNRGGPWPGEAPGCIDNKEGRA